MAQRFNADVVALLDVDLYPSRPEARASDGAAMAWS